MEDTNDSTSVKDKVVGSIRRNKVRIAYYTAGVGVGVVATRIYGNAKGAAFYRQVVETIDTTGEYRLPTFRDGIELVIKEAAKS